MGNRWISLASRTSTAGSFAADSGGTHVTTTPPLSLPCLCRREQHPPSVRLVVYSADHKCDSALRVPSRRVTLHSMPLEHLFKSMRPVERSVATTKWSQVPCARHTAGASVPLFRNHRLKPVRASRPRTAIIPYAPAQLHSSWPESTATLADGGCPCRGRGCARPWRTGVCSSHSRAERWATPASVMVNSLKYRWCGSGCGEGLFGEGCLGLGFVEGPPGADVDELADAGARPARGRSRCVGAAERHPGVGGDDGVDEARRRSGCAGRPRRRRRRRRLHTLAPSPNGVSLATATASSASATVMTAATGPNTSSS